eukprot:4868434-Amphidinium_carterae.2
MPVTHLEASQVLMLHRFVLRSSTLVYTDALETFAFFCSVWYWTTIGSRLFCLDATKTRSRPQEDECFDNVTHCVHLHVQVCVLWVRGAALGFASLQAAQLSRGFSGELPLQCCSYGYSPSLQVNKHRGSLMRMQIDPSAWDVVPSNLQRDNIQWQDPRGSAACSWSTR